MSSSMPESLKFLERKITEMHTKVRTTTLRSEQTMIRTERQGTKAQRTPNEQRDKAQRTPNERVSFVFWNYSIQNVTSVLK